MVKLSFNILIYVIKLTYKLVFVFKNESPLKVMLFCIYYVMVIFMYSLPLLYVSFGYSVMDLVNTLGTMTVLYGEGKVKYDGPAEFPNYGEGNEGGGNFGGESYKIDLDNLPENVSLPSNYYQSGTVRQRAEMLLIVQEICSRPEILLTLEELLGVFYLEQNGNFNAKTSLVMTTMPESYNSAGYGGPFQHGKHTWYSTSSSTMKETVGKTFISSLENKNIQDEKRVLSVQESSNLKTPDGKRRPNMFYFSDAAYTTAWRVSEYKKNLYNGNTDKATKPVFDWISSSPSMSESVQNFQKYNQALERYSGYNGYLPNSDEKDNCCRSWIPSMYKDLIDQKGDINQWSDFASSRRKLLSTLGGGKVGNVSYHGGDGLVGQVSMSSDYPEQPKRSLSNYKEYWTKTGGNHLPSHYYGFGAINGGKWIYEGLCALGDVVGTKNPGEGGAGNNGTGGPDDFGDWVCPLDFDKFVITSEFHEDRLSYAHKGVDVDTGTGDNVRTPIGGKVTRAGWDSATLGGKYPNRGGGKMVFVEMDNGYEVRVMHLDKILSKVGDKVNSGDIVGLSGNTGGSSGDHLHIELWKNGVEINPTFFFKSN